MGLVATVLGSTGINSKNVRDWYYPVGLRGGGYGSSNRPSVGKSIIMDFYRAA
jgi:hypothetical protein